MNRVLICLNRRFACSDHSRSGWLGVFGDRRVILESLSEQPVDAAVDTAVVHNDNFRGCAARFMIMARRCNY